MKLYHVVHYYHGSDKPATVAVVAHSLEEALLLTEEWLIDQFANRRENLVEREKCKQRITSGMRKSEPLEVGSVAQIGCLGHILYPKP